MKIVRDAALTLVVLILGTATMLGLNVLRLWAIGEKIVVGGCK